MKINNMLCASQVRKFACYSPVFSNEIIANNPMVYVAMGIDCRDYVTGIGNCIERARPMCVTDKTRMRKQLVYYY